MGNIDKVVKPAYTEDQYNSDMENFTHFRNIMRRWFVQTQEGNPPAIGPLDGLKYKQIDDHLLEGIEKIEGKWRGWRLLLAMRERRKHTYMEQEKPAPQWYNVPEHVARILVEDHVVKCMRDEAKLPDGSTVLGPARWQVLM